MKINKKLLIIFVIIFIIILVLFFFLNNKTSNNTNQNTVIPSVSTKVTSVGNAQSLKIDSFSNTDAPVSIYIDRSTGFLKSFQPDEVLYNKPVFVYSYRYPYIAIIQRDDRSFITLLNLSTKQTKQYKIDKENSFISLSLSPDSSIIFALGSFNTTDHTSQLYSINVKANSNTPISRVKDVEVNAIDNLTVVLLDSGESQNSSGVQIYNTNNKSIIYQADNVNQYLLSPNSTKLVTRSAGVAIAVDLKTSIKNQFLIDENDLIIWRDDKTLVVIKNTFPGVQIAYVNTETDHTVNNFLSINELKDRSVAFATAIYNNQLVLADNMYRFFLVTLP